MKSVFLSILITTAFVFCSWNVDRYSITPQNEVADTKKSLKRKTDVQVNFCLLNEAGKVSNVFGQGENFSFFLTLENSSDETLFLDNSFLSDGNGFCAVYTIDNQLVGQPFAYGGSKIVSSDTHPFYGNNRIFQLTIPWKDTRSQWTALHHNFRGLNQKELPAGKYYTVFRHRFCFDRSSDKPSLCLNPVNIRIDFEVK